MGRFGLPGAQTPSPAAAASGPTPAPAAPAQAPEQRLASPPPPPLPPKAQPHAKGAPPSQLDIRLRLHSRLIEELDLAKLDKLDEKDMRREVMSLVADFARAERMALNTADLQELGASIFDEMVGLGPLEPLLKDESINDILINGPFQVYVERRGELELTPVRFRDNDHLLRIVNRIVAGVGRRIDESQPMVDARLADGSRVNAAISPIAIDGAAVSIRKFSKKPLTLEKLVGLNAMPMCVADFMHGAVKARISTVISGGTGSGKTTLLNALSAAISHGERLITIEDAAELQLQQPHVVRLETRPPNIEGKGEIRQRELVKNALRMRPDRVILGEVRADEAFDMLQAMNTGHEGSMATIHANNPREAIGRLEQMIAMGGLAISPDAMRQQIASAIGMIVQVMRLADGKRKITHVTEITGMEGQVVQMQDIFTFNRTHTDADGTVHGEFRATGLRPRCIEEMQRRGIAYDMGNFDPSRILGGLMKFDGNLVFLILVFAAVFTAGQAVIGLVSVATQKRKMNKRLKVAERVDGVSALVMELRKQRGLDAAGERGKRLRWLSNLIVASGVVYDPRKWTLYILAAAFVGGAAPAVLLKNPMFFPIGAVLMGVAGPIFYLKFMAGKRAKALGFQLPQALEIIVRSLEAGHPVPTAINLVGREMSDPVGTEFGMAADEIAYGSTMQEAIARMSERCQHPDVDLFAATVRLQERAGGNLTGLLKLNANTVRERHKMRLKIKAASSEGRASALILTSAPFLAMGFIMVSSPHFYGDVIHEPIVKWGLCGLGVWMFIGNMVMRRMIDMRL